MFHFISYQFIVQKMGAIHGRYSLWDLQAVLQVCFSEIQCRGRHSLQFVVCVVDELCLVE